MPLCQSCGDTGSGVYCSACGERREPRATRTNRELAVSPLHVREALFAQQREAETLYGVDDSPQTPTNFAFRNASEMRWCTLRALLQRIMLFDEEWIVDTPRSELLWQATCLQQGIERDPFAATKTKYVNDGPVGFTWWGSPLPQTVEVVHPEGDIRGISRVKVSVTLGRVADGAMRELLMSVVPGLPLSLPLSAFLVDDEGDAMLVCALAMDSPMVEEVAHFVSGMLTRQMMWGLHLQRGLSAGGYITEDSQPHPAEGVRSDADELVWVLLGSSSDRAPSGPGPLRSPEGVPLPDVHVPGLSSAVAGMLGWQEGVSEDGDGISYFFSPGSASGGSPAFFYREVPDLFEHAPGLQSDPGLVFGFTAGYVAYATQAEAVEAANKMLAETWGRSSANVLGNFRIMSGLDGSHLVVGPMSFWPAPAIYHHSDGSGQTLAETIFHVAAHLGNQNDLLLKPD